MDGETAAMRVNAQAPQEEKVAHADVVIDTDGTMADTRHFFEIAWERVLQTLPDPLRPASAGVSVSSVSVSSVSVSSVGEEKAPAAVVERPVEEVGEEKAPPERLSGSKAAEIRQRMLAKKQEAESAGSAQTTEGAKEVVEKAADAIVVRRARPSDVPSILLLIQRATGGAVKMKRGELLMALGDRGYLIGQQGTEISTVIGWNSENLVARIDQIFVHPPEAARIAGPAVLKEIEDTAISLICEVILAFPTNQVEPAVLQLFLDNSFEEVDALRLPEAWKAAVDESQPENTFVMMKVLRDTRSMQPG
jgi:N-acetylglutamate synthase-like GNAT family acetyltransferase